MNRSVLWLLLLGAVVSPSVRALPVPRPPSPPLCSMWGYPDPYPFGSTLGYGKICDQCGDFWAAVVANGCSNGVPPVCVTKNTCPGEPCTAMSWFACTTGTPLIGTIRPRYYPTHVIYAPPGRSSTMNYSTGSTIGTNIQMDMEFKNQTNVKVTATAGVKDVFGLSVSVNAGQTWDDTSTTGEDVSLTYTAGYQVPGEMNGIDHNWDQVWFLVRPALSVSVLPPQGWPVSAPQTMEWSFNTDAQTTTYFLYVGELTGAFPLTQGVQDALNNFGITKDDFQQLLKTDPIYQGTQPNQALDPNRFAFVAQMPYTPPLAANAVPSKQTYTVSRGLTVTNQNKLATTFTVGAEIQGSAGLPLTFSVSANVNFQMSWITTTTTKHTNATNTTESLVIAQPDFGYTGPTILRVYEDLMWHTYVFALDKY